MLLALDLSTVATGWSIWDGEELIDHGVIKPKKSDKPMKRIHMVWLEIEKQVNTHDIDEVIIEDVYASGSYTTFKTLAKMQGIIEMRLIVDKHIPVYFTMPTSWKSVAGVKGKNRKLQKQASVTLVERNHGIEVSDDEADAINMGWATMLQKRGK